MWWLEWWSIILFHWLLLDLLWRNWNVLLKNFSVSVEVIKLTNSLFEWLVLKLLLMLFSFNLCESFWSIVVILSVWNLASKVCLFTYLTSLRWVSDKVSWSSYNITRIVIHFEILLNVGNLLHVFIWCISWHLNMSSWFELQFMTCSSDFVEIYFPCHNASSNLLEWLSNSIVSWLIKQSFINGRSFLNRIGNDIWRVSYDLTLALNYSCCETENARESLQKYTK